MEFFGWRQFRNRREVAALAGLTPTPYQSGESNHEQGISKVLQMLGRFYVQYYNYSYQRTGTLCLRASATHSSSSA